jgi:alpha-mannosidase
VIESLFDKKLDREMLSAPANRLVMFEDYPVSWDAWDINHYYRETEAVQPRVTSRTVVENSGLRASVRQEMTLDTSTIVQTVTLRAGDAEVRIHTHVDWHQESRLLRVHADTTIHAQEATYEIQFGNLTRPTYVNTSWDAARFEVCGHRYADLSEPDCGIALLNDSKYGFRCVDGALELSLLRSARSPDRVVNDEGEHEFTYSYLSHEGDCAHSNVRAKAHELNAPLHVVPLAGEPTQRETSRFSVDTTRVCVDTVKKAESSDDLVLRMYETSGARTRARLVVPEEFTSACEADLEENRTGDEVAVDRDVVLEFRPYEIKTVLLSR